MVVYLPSSLAYKAVFAGFFKAGSEATLSVLKRFWGFSHVQKGMRGEPPEATKYVGVRRYGLWDHNLGDTGSAAAGCWCWWWIRPAKILPGASDQPGTGLHRGLGALTPSSRSTTTSPALAGASCWDCLGPVSNNTVKMVLKRIGFERRCRRARPAPACGSASSSSP